MPLSRRYKTTEESEERWERQGGIRKPAVKGSKYKGLKRVKGVPI